MRGSRSRVGPRPTAFTFIEVVVASLILAIVLYVLMGLLTQGSKLSRQELDYLGLQADSQRALARFLKDLQEAIEVVAPQPGGTLPYAVIRDKLNRFVVYSLTGSGAGGEYDLQTDVVSPQGRTTDIMLKGVARLTFSSLSDGALRLHMTLATGARRYAFYTEIRLRNREAAGG